MRSRYSAYALGLSDYLHATWHPSTRPTLEQLQSDGGLQWRQLQLLATHTQDLQATVEFIAHFKHGGRAGKVHECSRFVYEHAQWFYLDAEFIQ